MPRRIFAACLQAMIPTVCMAFESQQAERAVTRDCAATFCKGVTKLQVDNLLCHAWGSIGYGVATALPDM